MSVAIATAARHSDFDHVVQRTREVLKENGFGVLTEIDVQATLKEKLGEEMERYLILGACNPPMAHRAVSAEKQIGVLLPCNVVVREDPAASGTIHIEALNPALMGEVVDNPELTPVAEQVAEKIQRVVDTLASELA